MTVSEFQPWPRHEPGWFLLEWDVALDRRSRDRFARNAMAWPDRVRVAPYTLYPASGRPQQVHRWHGRPLDDGEPYADSFGLGCIYLPQAVLDAFLADPPRQVARLGFNDTVFSDWHRTRIGPVAVDWSVHPQHVHGD